MRDGLPIGVMTLVNRTWGHSPIAQIALLRTFAEQAVIVITSAKNPRELQERTAALAARNSE